MDDFVDSKWLGGRYKLLRCAMPSLFDGFERISAIAGTVGGEFVVKVMD